MSMLLTVSQPRFEFGNRSITHDFSPSIPSLSRSRPASPKPKVETSVTLRASNIDARMSTPHRGLPPPSAMNLPDPSSRPPPTLGQPLGGMPNPPHQWQGQEESMRNWLLAKAEEDKRKQEEERTRQESLKLEQRRIEQSMLRESLQGGVPPHLVPMIYAGMGGASLANVSLDWLQQYTAQLQQQQQQQIQAAASPELRRETRLISQAPYAQPPQQQQVLPSQPAMQPQSSQGAPLQTTFSAYQPPPASPRRGPTSQPRAAQQALPRLTTNEMYVQPTPQGPGSAHPLQQSQIQESSSPSIYFHHWVPPDQKNNHKDNMPQTPASKEPQSAHPGSHISESEYKDSPRKRKAQGGHQANPPPSAGPQYTSPSFSTASSSSGRRGGGHIRSRSNVSVRGTESRPESRRQPSPPRSTQPDSRAEPEERRSRETTRQPGERDSRPSSEAPRGIAREASQMRRPTSAPREDR